MNNKTKENVKAAVLLSLIIIGVLAVLLGIRLVLAKVVYHDMRCAFAECRIQVNP